MIRVRTSHRVGWVKFARHWETNKGLPRQYLIFISVSPIRQSNNHIELVRRLYLDSGLAFSRSFPASLNCDLCSDQCRQQHRCIGTLYLRYNCIGQVVIAGGASKSAWFLRIYKIVANRFDLKCVPNLLFSKPTPLQWMLLKFNFKRSQRFPPSPVWSCSGSLWFCSLELVE